MKSRTKFPPHGWQLLLPEVGMQKPVVGSFSECVVAFAKIVARNRGLAQKYGWPTDLKGQENWVDERECGRLIAQGWSEFVEFNVTPTEPSAYLAPEKKNLLGRAVEVGKAAKAGIGVWLDMFGPNAKPVERAVAERRAAVCVTCLQNDTVGRLEDHFIQAALRGVQFVYQMLKDLTWSTTQDANLGVCRVCLCPLKSKVHVELPHIERHMTPEIKSQLPPHCWIVQRVQ